MILRVWDVTFTVSDLGRAVDFYENTLGLSQKYHYLVPRASFAGLVHARRRSCVGPD
jgi:catechol 2,3-dioxygenase-like lactoylglutathione lyase family enzyme